ncbi:STAS domain-containing protein [Nonomuraea sp. NPDC050783]|uniref:STAS domain-containing protein n=1 Tax=Nonomuraea sp. NPDC050783 TaxID=3154634 RepID=UPI00346554BA
MHPDLFALSSAMSRPRLSLAMTINDRPEATVRIIAWGELETCTAGALCGAVRDALRRHRPARIEVDLTGITFIDARGISALVTSQEDAAQLGCRLAVPEVGRMVRRVLGVVGLLEQLGVVPVPRPRRHRA